VEGAAGNAVARAAGVVPVAASGTGAGIGVETGADEVRGVLPGSVFAACTGTGFPGSITLSFTLKTSAFLGSSILPLARYATTSPPVNSGVRIAIGITYLFFFISDSATPLTGLLRLIVPEPGES